MKVSTPEVQRIFMCWLVHMNRRCLHPHRSCPGYVFRITGRLKSFHDPAMVHDTIQGSRPNQTSTNGCLGSRMYAIGLGISFYTELLY
ncbi:hypothetical protein P153DRAFT_81771 [Dothidotthia symphoricarpi CBS 119687]|uniref:Uncharacterized protein n=1 Tax=Dothidotthia symphoricarpi CBS 119687 TaxID=1392245 RepID=A0A6A6A4B7_9PLEO|nr:uncharacterized protein P153DRAFT_81771 [Dothidotthia symphoricarpi CBS 119687]KAF2126650.1 hypothetical protein P153DRAFT_81771 [Dothidotthia symphoricarpi CBS 119687]